MKNKTFISSKEIKEMIFQLSEKIKKSGKEYDYIVGIARGGLNISKPLSKLLKVKHISIRVSFYGKKGTISPYPRLIDTTSLEGIVGNDLLFVDDLIDNGHTINWINKNLSTNYGPFDIAVLHHNKNNEYKINPTFYVKEKPKAWVVYPWE
jgi:uncharacterized protein